MNIYYFINIKKIEINSFNKHHNHSSYEKSNYKKLLFYNLSFIASYKVFDENISGCIGEYSNFKPLTGKYVFLRIFKKTFQ